MNRVKTRLCIGLTMTTNTSTDRSGVESVTVLAKYLTLAVAALLAAAPLNAKDNPYAISARTDEHLRRCFDDLFNLRFDEADKSLSRLKDDGARHPMAALAEVVRAWWELSVNVIETDEQESRRFLEASERCIRLAQKRIDKGDRTGEAYVALGTTLGLISRWSASNHAWLPAYVRGRKSAAALRKALEINPRATDAYMTLGTFNYARELIRKRMGNEKPSADDVREEEKKAGGDLAQSDDGIAQLRKAYQGSVYFKTAAGPPAGGHSDQRAAGAGAARHRGTAGRYAGQSIHPYAASDGALQRGASG